MTMTANPLKGETELKAGEETYILALSINELVRLEQLLDVGIIEIAEWFNDAKRIRVGNMRAILWAALQRHHEGVTLEQAGDIISAVGLGVIVDTLGTAVQASFPEAEVSENPPNASRRGGTGKPS
jgi:hypothetical protein